MLLCFTVSCLLFDLRLGHFVFILHAHMRAFLAAQLELSQKSQTFLKHYWLDVLIGHAYVKMHGRRKTLDNIHIDGHF